MWMRLFCGCVLSLLTQASSAATLPALFDQAKTADPLSYQFALNAGAQFLPTTDGKSYYVMWQPAGSTLTSPPEMVISLHGHGAYALGEFQTWKAAAEARGYGVIALQWWMGAGDTTADYYTPTQMYTEIAAACKALNLRKRSVLFHGFSRGSANSYAVAAVQHASGDNFFRMVFSDAGGVATDYPPNIDITKGVYGTQPFSGLYWAMYCGGLDPDPTINGEPAMLLAKTWVEKYAATVDLFIDDPTGSHGTFHTKPEYFTALFNAFAARPQTNPPTLNALSVSTGSTLGGTLVTISGTDISPTGTVTVNFGGVAASSVVVSSSTSLSCVAPAHAAGIVDVVVTNPDNQPGKRVSGFTYSVPAPSITSAACATPSVARVGQSVSFNVAASGGSGTISYAWAFGDGSSGTGSSTTHVYAAAGVQNAVVTISDGTSSLTSSVSVTVNAPVAGAGIDSDGDGFSDALEVAAGSDPLLISSTPGGISAGSVLPLSVSPMSISLNFRTSTNHDSISFSASVSLPDDYSFTNQPVVVDVAGFSTSVTLSKSRSGTSGSVKVTLGKPRKSSAKLTYKMSNATLASALTVYNLTNETVKSARTVSVPVTVIINATVFAKTETLSYTAHQNSTGKASAK